MSFPFAKETFGLCFSWCAMFIPSVKVGYEEDCEFASNYEYVMVFPYKDNKQTEFCRYACSAMLKAGFILYPYLSVQKDEVYVLITCNDEILQHFADVLDVKLEMNAPVIQQLLEAGSKVDRIAPVKILHRPEVTPLNPFVHIYGRYDTELPQDMYVHGPEGGKYFNSATTLKLIYYKLTMSAHKGGCNFNIPLLLQKGDILAFYPMHNLRLNREMLGRVLEYSRTPWNMPVEDIRNYFGEKMALYYSFMGQYSFYLILPALVGLALQLVVWGTGNFSSPVLPFFALFISIWAIVFLEHWKREEFRIALRWGMTDHEDTELDRIEFKGDHIKSFIDGSDITYFPPQKRTQRVTTSVTFIIALVLLVTGVVASIYVMRFALQHTSIAPFASLIASVLNTVQISVFNIIYSWVCVSLTDHENHRTDTEYEDAMIAKLFCFQFINSYASFFFLAFVAPFLDPPDDNPHHFIGQCGAKTCMLPLSINIAIIFGTRLVLGNAMDIILPYYQYKHKHEQETKGTTGPLSRPEKDYLLIPYNVILDSINDFADCAVQFGFMTLFITALPVACLFAVFSNHFRIKSHSWKVFVFHQRVLPRGAQDIGLWQTIFEVISIAGTISNAGMICYTMDVLNGFSVYGRGWVFVGFSFGIIAIQFLVSAIIPDRPPEIDIQLRRQDFIVKKLIDKVADEDYESEMQDLENPNVDFAAKLHKLMESSPDVEIKEYPFAKEENCEEWPSGLTKAHSIPVIKMEV